MLKRLDSSLAATDDRGNLIVGHIAKELQRQHLLLVKCQLTDRLLKRDPVVDRKYLFLTTRVDYLDALIQRCRYRSLAPRLTDQHIVGDRVEPAQERLLTTV